MQSCTRYLTLAFLYAVLIGCGHAEPIYNVSNNPVPSSMAHRLSADDVGKIIASTALKDKWIADAVMSGVFRCTLQWRIHLAVINISYSDRSYTISYVSSENLQAEGGDIHPKYNKFIRKLRYDIDHALSSAANQ